LFQQALSFEKTPTLPVAVPAYELFQRNLQQLQEEDPDSHIIIQAGIQKLDLYSGIAMRTPACLLAVGK
jgi:hypothetical protein